MKRRPDHTPDNPDVFVFGSNELGIHGAGAARYARIQLGAKQRVGLAKNERSYALPTCSEPGIPLSLAQVGVYVGLFIVCAKARPDLRFYVSPVGCGLAGYTEDEIAPLFKDAPENCELPEGWR